MDGEFCFLFFVIPVLIAIPFMNMEINNRINYIALLFGFLEKDLYEYGLNKYISDQKYKKEINEENNELYEKNVKRIKEIFRDIFYYAEPAQCLIMSK